MNRFLFIASSLFIAFAPLLFYAGYREANRWDMFAHTKRMCVYDIYPEGTGPERRLTFTREDFRTAPKLFVLPGREQWRNALTALCRSRSDLRNGKFAADLKCFEREWMTNFTNQPVSCER